MSRTILIVDDSKVERIILEGLLKSNYNVIEAGTGEQAVEILHKKYRVISAIVMDIVMPGMGGFNSLKTIKMNTVWAQIPIIITTGLDDEDSREKAIAYGADNYVTKPYNRALLLHIVHNAIKLRETAAIANALWRDPLTGLLNRESFFREAERMIKRHEAGYYVLSCFDVENFKVINDQYGAESGDDVLKHIANSLNTFVAGINGITCRYMADKFAILYPAFKKDTDEISENHKETMSPKCIKQKIRIRIGRYFVTDTSIPVGAMFDRASMAQESIRGRYDTYIAEYTDLMRTRLLNEQRIVNNMDKALKNGEFQPWLQPQYNHVTGALIGAEALVRWHKGNEYISPAEFVPVFERNGFIYEMDRYIWESVCILLRRWIDEGRDPLPVSINISRRDLFHKHFISVLTGIVNKYNLPYDLVRLEVTESAFAEAAVIKKVDELIDLGFTVEIDDFGSGYSSLNTLKDVPASILKLDMKFFENTENSQRSGNIVESVVRMAKWLDMAVIAEGVEDRQQADFLKSIGCYYIQGYVYSKPVPVEEYEKLLDSREAEHNLSRLHTLDTLNNSEFWNPKSIETLIFNSYVGGACIFEFHNGKSELIRMNEQYTRELGKLFSEGTRLPGASIVKFLSPEDRERAVAAIYKAIETKNEASFEAKLTDNVNVEYMRMTIRVIANTGSRYLCYGVVLNITDLRISQQKELEAAAKLDAVLNHAGNGITAIALRGEKPEFLFANGRYFEIVGYKRENYEALTKNDMFAPVFKEDREELRKCVTELNKSFGSTVVKFRVIKETGEIVWIKSVITITQLAGIDVPVQIAMFSDITAEKKAEEQKIKLLDNLPCGAALFEYDGEKLSVIHINKYYWEMVEREPVDYSKASMLDVVHPDDRKSIIEKVEYAVRNNQDISLKIRIMCGKSSYRNFSVSASIKPADDGKYLFFTSYNIISE